MWNEGKKEKGSSLVFSVLIPFQNKTKKKKKKNSRGSAVWVKITPIMQAQQGHKLLSKNQARQCRGPLSCLRNGVGGSSKSRQECKQLTPIHTLFLCMASWLLPLQQPSINHCSLRRRPPPFKSSGKARLTNDEQRSQGTRARSKEWSKEQSNKRKGS